MAGVITERDMTWLRWLARWRCVRADQVAAWWIPETASGTKVVEARLRVWRAHGLVWSERVFADLPSVHGLTGAGLALVGVGGPRRDVIVAQLRHDLALVDCATWLRGQLPAARFLTEREIRAMETPKAPSFRAAVPAVPGSGKKVLYPDLLSVEVGGTVIAHEVELAVKDGPRLERLMESYASADHISGVVYYAREAARRRIEAAAEAVKARAELRGQLANISVRGWEWSE